MKKKFIVMVSLVIGLSMVLTACTPTAAPTTTLPVTEAVTEVATEAVPEGMLPEVDPASLTGDINIAGSSTVYPLSEAVAENFNKDGFTGNVNIASVGTGGGFERFCKTGETDIANASRAIKDSEMEACAALNPARVPLEFRVGTDAIAVVVSKENTFAKDITLEELGLLFTSAEKWSDVRADWPAEPIQRFTPGTDSGTFDFFVEVVIQKPQKIEKLDDAKKLALDATNIQTSEDDNVLVQGVEGSPYAIGYFGFAYYKQQESRLIALSVDGIAPSFETAESGEYVLARPLFIYSDANVLKQKPQVAGFINYFLTYVNEWIDDVGYFPASEEALNTARQLFLDAVK
ncbi:MAG TPA: PstS family phosphate ABC transporter substrate-binding protein [Anaerolineaceae bacterium]|nr:PstS family phosphate ABC transporter substrate-binding protein [Anaerolineaceae bacterium]HQF45787.1 PstS family phosphate ABC transporter substrate-binding protein [Anaerolineaceae bacterium]HQH35550.1 PstS family phosphate ABC transporter substrate-binding protein [Anaerolineaceae bacterium]HQJ03365.1 PstS family phosphate ABC transporter substrate-binding protein [Anaerolineaceae bacterium]